MSNQLFFSKNEDGLGIAKILQSQLIVMVTNTTLEKRLQLPPDCTGIASIKNGEYRVETVFLKRCLDNLGKISVPFIIQIKGGKLQKGIFSAADVVNGNITDITSRAIKRIFLCTIIHVKLYNITSIYCDKNYLKVMDLVFNKPP